jgi:hypothetical protein
VTEGRGGGEETEQGERGRKEERQREEGIGKDGKGGAKSKQGLSALDQYTVRPTGHVAASNGPRPAGRGASSATRKSNDGKKSTCDTKQPKITCFFPEK